MAKRDETMITTDDTMQVGRVAIPNCSTEGGPLFYAALKPLLSCAPASKKMNAPEPLVQPPVISASKWSQSAYLTIPASFKPFSQPASETQECSPTLTSPIEAPIVFPKNGYFIVPVHRQSYSNQNEGSINQMVQFTNACKSEAAQLNTC